MQKLPKIKLLSKNTLLFLMSDKFLQSNNDDNTNSYFLHLIKQGVDNNYKYTNSNKSINNTYKNSNIKKRNKIVSLMAKSLYNNKMY